MTPAIIGGIGIIVLFLLMSLGVPIGFAMGLVGSVGFAVLVNINAAFFQATSVPFSLVTDYSYCVIPLFILMAQIIYEAGFSKDIYYCAYKWLGKIPGGLALATILSCAVFAAVCASSIASAITMGLVAIPEMEKYKYNQGLSCATVVAGGTLGVLIPPSGILIVYAILTEQSIGKLFVAGVVPGILLSLLFMSYILIRVKFDPKMAPQGPSICFGEKVKALGGSIEIMILIAVILGGLALGWFSPTQAGAVGAFGAILLSLVRRRLTVNSFLKAIRDTMRNTGMIFTILIGAFLLNVFLAMSEVPMILAQAVTDSALPPIGILAAMLITLVVLGCFIDAMAMVILTIPIFFPIAMAIHLDPVLFGILIVIVAEMAMITPPVGMNVFAISGIAKHVPMQVIFKSSLPFVMTMAVFIVLLISFPQIVSFLPEFFGM